MPISRRGSPVLQMPARILVTAVRWVQLLIYPQPYDWQPSHLAALRCRVPIRLSTSPPWPPTLISPSHHPPPTHQVPRPSDDEAHSCLGFSRNFVAVIGWELPLETWLLGLLLQLVPPLHVALLHARAGFQLPGSRPPPAGAAVVGKVIVLDGCRCLGDLHALATIHTAGKARSHRHSPPLPRIAHGAALP
jgi:hypothetical protein